MTETYFPKLETAHLHNNRLAKFDLEKALTNWPRINTLSINGNNLSIIPDLRNIGYMSTDSSENIISNVSNYMVVDIRGDPKTRFSWQNSGLNGNIQSLEISFTAKKLRVIRINS